MPFLLVLAAVALFGAGVVFLARALSARRLRVVGTVRNISTYGVSVEEVAPRLEPAQGSVLAPVVDRVGRAVPAGMIPLRTLRSAGMYNIPPERFQGYRVIGALAVLGPVLAASLRGSLKPMTLVMTLTGAAIVWLLAPVVVRTRSRRRLDQIDRVLPQFIDVLTATVEAGLGFAGSLQLVAGRFGGPLGRELRVMLQEQSMGLSTERALQNLLERCETPSVRAFVRAVTQGEALGVSIGQMLRNLAGEARKRRRQSAEEKMMKAPVKMMFPLVLLMLPALFIVLMYPAVHNVLHTLGTGH